MTNPIGSINPAILPYVPKSLIVASDPAVREGMLWLIKAYGANLPRGVDANAAVVLMLAAEEYGLSPLEGITKLFMIGGRIVPSANTLLELAQRKGLAVQPIINSDEAYEAQFTRPGREMFTYRYTIEEAKKAGLTNSDTWKKYPRQMLAARGNSTALRLYAGDLIGSGYSAEEAANGDGKFDAQGNFTPDETITGPAPTDKTFVPFEGRPPQKSRTDDHTAEVAAAAGVQPKQVAPPVVNPPTTATATQFQKALPGKITQADLDLTPGLHIELITKGQLPSVKETTATIFAAFKEIYPEEMAKSVLSEKVKSYGADAAAKLSPLDFMDLYRWADGEVAKVKAQDAVTPVAAPDAPIEEQAPESPEHVPAGTEVADFNPHRGAATKPGGPVTDSAPASNIDEEIVAAWQELAAKDREAEGDAVFEKFGYQVGAEGVSQQMRRLVLQELKQLQAA